MQKNLTSIRNAVRIFDRSAYVPPGHMPVHIFSPARLNNLHSKQHGQKKAKQPKICDRNSIIISIRFTLLHICAT
jgi:hypothetical protein